MSYSDKYNAGPSISIRAADKLVDRPAGVPLEPAVYLSSLDYKIEDIEGQCVKDWFKNDFGAANTFEFQAKVKGSAGRAKAKLLLNPIGKSDIRITEDVEIQTNIDYGIQGLFKIRPKEVSAQFDLGMKPIAGNWFNPYVVFRLPRVGGVLKTTGSVGLGGVFHFDKYLNRRVKHQAELNLGFGQEVRNEVFLRQNLSTWYRNFVFGWYESWNLTNGFSRESKVSASFKDGSVRAYGQIELDNKLRLTSTGFGASYQINQDVKIFAQTAKPWNFDHKPLEIDQIRIMDLGAGVDINHSATGVGVKLGYFHQKKIASVLSFKLNKYFSGSLLFDVTYG
jgi:hypothetical protein